MQPLLTVTQLSKHFGSLTAVNRVSFHVERGQILAFIGPNGAGKTTTIRMIAGYLLPSEGDFFYNGVSFSDDPFLLRSHLGYLAEGCPLYHDMNVLDFLKYSARIHHMTRTKEKERLAFVLETLQLCSVRHVTIRTLSKGYKRRVGLAQAILHDPDLLILDEPTDGLDPLQKDEVYKLLQELGKEKAIIFSTHNLEEAYFLAGRAVIIHRGEIAAYDSPAAIISATGAANFDEAFKMIIKKDSR
ncbi:MAG: ABC transporter ATP-binding protein [Alphaproteobacteria bacterium]|nr:ABC transporter ATP-binding protein [Alphaproteobacteria bacterium]